MNRPWKLRFILPYRFHKLLKNIIVNEEAQIHCLKIVNEFWSTHPQVCH